MRLPAPFSGRRRQSSTPPRTDPPEVPTQQEVEAALLADKIRQLGMAGPAIVFLHAFKPLAWLGGQLLWALEPFVGGPPSARQSALSPGGLARFLEREGSVEEVVALLESPSDVEKDSTPPGAGGRR